MACTDPEEKIVPLPADYSGGLTKRELMAALIMAQLSGAWAHRRESWDDIADSAVKATDALVRKLNEI